MKTKWIYLSIIILKLIQDHPLQAFDRQPPFQQEMGLIRGLNPSPHPVTTRSIEAQRFFDQGLTFIYAFNHDAAYDSFKKAAEIDPNMAMAYWGMALSLGTNINTPVTPEKEKHAYELVQQALKLMPNTTDSEQAYIKAISTRYSNEAEPDQKQLSLNYKNAMKEVVNKHPDDLDAATLYAESILDLNPWNQWTLDGQPNEGTMEAVSTLESVLKRDPNHIGANHYYIHAVEASNHPEWALPSANRLRYLSPVAGHLLHMPSHIYMLLGDYQEAARANQEAIAEDKAYMQAYGFRFYPLHYTTHNFSMLSRAYDMQGNFIQAKRTADELSSFYTPHFNQMPELEFYYSPPLFVRLHFHRWQEVLQLPPPPNPHMTTSLAFWHFGRAIAYASLGDEKRAEEEKNQFIKESEKIPPDTLFGLNTIQDLFRVANDYLNAKLAYLKNDLPLTIQLLQQAVANQDKLRYNEPPDWYFPIRESLGVVLLQNQQNKEAEEVFRQALNKHPRSGRALFGLFKSLQAQSRETDAFWIRRAFEQAWRNSDTPLSDLNAW